MELTGNLPEFSEVGMEMGTLISKEKSSVVHKRNIIGSVVPSYRARLLSTSAQTPRNEQ